MVKMLRIFNDELFYIHRNIQHHKEKSKLLLRGL